VRVLAVADAFAERAVEGLGVGVTGDLAVFEAAGFFVELAGALTFVGLVALALEAIVGLIAELSVGVAIDRWAPVEATLEALGLDASVGRADSLLDAPLRLVLGFSSSDTADKPSWSEIPFVEPNERRAVVVTDGLVGGLLVLFARFVRVVEDANGLIGDVGLFMTGAERFGAEAIDSGRRGGTFSLFEAVDGPP